VTRRRRKASTATLPLDPYLAFLVFVAVGLGTHRMGQDARLVLLWVVLLGASLIFAEQQPIDLQYVRSRAGQGAAVGLVLAVPLLVLALEPLRATTTRLYPLGSNAAVFQGLVLVATPVEEVFFRGVLQRQHGFWAATALYGLAGLVFFLPTAAGFPIVLLAVVLGMAVLGMIYGYVALRYGLAASVACHAGVNRVLFVLRVGFGSSGP